LVGSSRAADIGVVGLKLIVVDKVTAAGKAKAVFVSKDKTNGITKGPRPGARLVLATAMGV
jgi:hypothetical protein